MFNHDNVKIRVHQRRFVELVRAQERQCRDHRRILAKRDREISRMIMNNARLRQVTIVKRRALRTRLTNARRTIEYLQTKLQKHRIRFMRNPHGSYENPMDDDDEGTDTEKEEEEEEEKEEEEEEEVEGGEYEAKVGDEEEEEEEEKEDDVEEDEDDPDENEAEGEEEDEEEEDEPINDEQEFKNQKEKSENIIKEQAKTVVNVKPNVVSIDYNDADAGDNDFSELNFMCDLTDDDIIEGMMAFDDIT